MALKLWIVLATVVVAVQSHVVRSPKVDLGDGMTVEVIIRPNSEKIDGSGLEESGRREARRTHDVVVPIVATKTSAKDVKVGVEGRFGIRSGVCPVGYVQTGGFCFPDYD